MIAVMEWLLWAVVGASLLVGIAWILGFVLMAREGYKETPKTAFIYTICIGVLYLGLVALGASWLTAAAPAIFFGVILAMWAADWLGVKEDN